MNVIKHIASATNRAVCFHCGVVIIDIGDPCYEVWTGRNIIWIAEFCKNDNNYTKE
jgi:hypothetical protein